jgi:nucleotidyltransferase substrate binding protein (TIGR01987 family)
MSNIQKLDISSLEKAISQLEQSLAYYHSEVVQRDPGLILQLRAAAIQAFEFTYELSWKMLKRYLERAEFSPGAVDEMSFPDLIRTACEQGLLLSDLSAWLVYRKERGATSHVYDQKKAQQVFEQIPAFLAEAKFLYAKLQERIKSL